MKLNTSRLEKKKKKKKIGIQTTVTHQHRYEATQPENNIRN